MDVAKNMADAIRRALDDVSDLSDNTCAVLQKALAAYDESAILDSLQPEHPRQLTATQWVERARNTLRELDAKEPNDDIGDAIDDLNNALTGMSERPEGLLILGDVVTGFTFVGPFACESDAAAYFQQHRKPGEDWQTCTMRAPETGA